MRKGQKIEGKAKITFSIGSGHDRESFLQIDDDASSTCIARITISPENLVKILSGQGYVDADMEYFKSEVVGKKLRCEHVKFELPNENWQNRKEIAKSLVDDYLKENYEGQLATIDKSFSSQDSFSQDGEVKYAHTTVRIYE